MTRHDGVWPEHHHSPSASFSSLLSDRILLIICLLLWICNLNSSVRTVYYDSSPSSFPASASPSRVFHEFVSFSFCSFSLFFAFYVSGRLPQPVLLLARHWCNVRRVCFLSVYFDSDVILRRRVVVLCWSSSSCFFCFPLWVGVPSLPLPLFLLCWFHLTLLPCSC